MIILYSVLVMLGVSLLLGSMVAIFAKVFEVEVDPKIEEAIEALPGYNCGACGYPGCEQYAQAVIEEGIDIKLCKPGGKETADELKAILEKE